MVNEKNAEMTVSVIMITYGHASYISQAIEGVLMQETNFDFELIIADDCSPDDTAKVVNDIINFHPRAHKIKYTKHLNNKGMQPNFVWASEQCKGAYIALCEGDDYWTDNLKLQKQVDFLNENLDFFGHAHQCSIIEDGKINKIFKANTKQVFEVKDLLGGRVYHTASLMFRSNVLKIFNPIAENVLSGDRLLNLCIASKGKIFFSQENMCIYRKHSEGISTTVKVKDLLKDLNSIKELKKINPSFPVVQYKSYIYLTIGLCKNATKLEKTYYLFLFGILSLFCLPQNFSKFTNYLKHYGK